MPQENVELVKSVQPTNVDLVEVFPENEVVDQAALTASPAAFAADFAVQFIAARGMKAPEYHDVDGLVKAWRNWLAPWASYQLDVEEFIAEALEAVGLSE